MRYKVINESVSAHCCLKATVVDSQTSRTVRECFNNAVAERMAQVLNAAEVATDIEYFEAFNIPTREWLIKRLMDGGGIAPEYGIVMLDKIEQLERDLESKQ